MEWVASITLILSNIRPFEVYELIIVQWAVRSASYFYRTKFKTSANITHVLHILIAAAIGIVRHYNWSAVVQYALFYVCNTSLYLHAGVWSWQRNLFSAVV